MTARRSVWLSTSVTSPRAMVILDARSPRCVCRLAASCSMRLGMRLAGDRVGAADLVLELDDPVEQCLRGGWASGHVNVDRYDAVAAAHDRIRIMVVASAVGAAPHGNHPAR